MIRGVIFDMDGVMIDSERQSNEGWLWAAEQLGVEMPMWLIDSFKGAPNTLSCQFFDNYYHGKIDYWEARKLRTGHIYKIREKEGLPIKKGLFELLDYIRENGIKCAVATSTRRESAENALPILHGNIWTMWFMGTAWNTANPNRIFFWRRQIELVCRHRSVLSLKTALTALRRDMPQA